MARPRALGGGPRPAHPGPRSLRARARRRPENAAANAALGRVQLAGQWVTPRSRTAPGPRLVRRRMGDARRSGATASPSAAPSERPPRRARGRRPRPRGGGPRREAEARAPRGGGGATRRLVGQRLGLRGYPLSVRASSRRLWPWIVRSTPMPRRPTAGGPIGVYGPYGLRHAGLPASATRVRLAPRPMRDGGGSTEPPEAALTFA